jgi:CubicO group peptidase (beta-lactamase class C family)
MTVEGVCAPAFAPVRRALSGLIESGQDVGASAAVMLRGELVADVWGGHLDEARTQPWLRDTIVNVFSTTKTMTNLSALLLADRGEIDVDAPVAKYWPEFAANDKEAVRVRHLLSHTSGLSGWQERLAPEDLFDWEKCTSLLAAQAPWWEPGARSGYHAFTQGYLVGEVVRRVTGQTIGEFFKRELAEPLDADFHIGTGPECDPRVCVLLAPSTLTEADLPPVDEASREIMVKTLMNPAPPAELSGTIPWRRAEIPAAGGHGNARSVATVQSVLSNLGTGGGKQILSEAGCRRALQEQSNGLDLVMGVALRFGTGYGLANETIPLPSPNSCFWGGWGGSLVVNDLDTNMTVAYVMNRMGPGTLGDERGGAIVAAAYEGLFAASQ